MSHMLANFSNQERLDFSRCLLEATSVTKGTDRFMDIHPYAYPYENKQLVRYRKSQSCLDDFAFYLESLRESPGGLLYSQRADRATVLIELLKMVLEDIRDARAQKERTPLAAVREAKGLVAEIRQETEPFDSTREGKLKSPWLQYAREEVKKRVSQEVAEEILEAPPN